MNAIRDQIVSFLQRELIGPDPRPEHADFLKDTKYDEILRPQDPPRVRYSAGVLFPMKSAVAAAEATSEEEGEAAENTIEEGKETEDATPDGDEVENHRTSGREHEFTEQEVNRANEFLPSAMGLTALVRLPDKLRITVQSACYESFAKEGLGKPDKKTGKAQAHHWRRPFELVKEIDGDALVSEGPVVLKPKVWIENSTGPETLELHVFSRPHCDPAAELRDRIVTFTLINRHVTGNRPRDEECFFQCGFRVEAADNSACFLEYPEHPIAETSTDEEGRMEEASLRLLYRHRRTFAIGHGCAANWTGAPQGTTASVWTETLPQWEIKPIVANDIENLDLSFAALSETTGDGSLELCDKLAKAYESWISAQETEVERTEFPEEHRSAANRHLTDCRGCLQRMRKGIELLRDPRNPAVRQAFAWMNEAMRLQQFRYDLATNYRREWEVNAGLLKLMETLAAAQDRQQANPKTRRLGRWRPFQLAFILMNLSAIADRASSDRKIVDLIWFPTGGGKTEAYLGLTGFTIFWRRLTNPSASGTTVLMRYTLRLLTTQQFQRAGSLMCACELIRSKNEERLGTARISIGLWVGADVTPNSHADSVVALNTLLRDGRENPFSVLTCPWCGAAMGPVQLVRGFRTPGYVRKDGRVIFRCEDLDCEFSKTTGLPIHVVDEDIYEERPTLLIGTVDKFASMPWRPDARRLFGIDDLAPVAPPDLIIQDELHLISGSLGSMVGLYEGTLDALCRHGNEKFPAKIIASTATICRAGSQIRALYARNSFLFPPQGLKAGDSFFAREVGDCTGRLYVGVFGSALGSHVTAQIRTTAALLQSVESVSNATAAEIDPYWTLMAYFNSLRELGHAATLIRADIRDHMNAMWNRLNIRSPKQGGGPQDRRRFIDRDIELTSRIQSKDIPKLLQRLFDTTGDTLRDDGRREQRAVDVCLATNMIQVGLDVPRLGLMTVTGQPKATSEYIQATSRVGRSESGPGLVVTIYNAAKPRDRSHFEHFRAYHQNIYRWVEPTSVTPFAIPVRERALHAQLITLARYLGARLQRENSTPPPVDSMLQEWMEVVLERVREIDPDEAESAKRMLEVFADDWKRLLPARYGQMANAPETPTPLLYPSGMPPFAVWGGRAKPTPISMRNVDATCDAAVVPDYAKP